MNELKYYEVTFETSDTDLYTYQDYKVIAKCYIEADDPNIITDNPKVALGTLGYPEKISIEPIQFQDIPDNAKVRTICANTHTITVRINDNH